MKAENLLEVKANVMRRLAQYIDLKYGKDVRNEIMEKYYEINEEEINEYSKVIKEQIKRLEK